ncbi:helix-turn-helix domain-containing protein, partial [Streptacidiphilus sp. EB129]|uniref:helix-turn-helix domain-containing protein n=1 Tax=Streptacidiphilus sp. EB129 TaxID=3156262 RepID=UPI00351347A0
MPQINLTAAHIAEALGVTEDRLREVLAVTTRAAHDPTLVALTPEEAARRLGVGRTTVYALIAADELASVKIGNRRRIPAESLGDFLAKRLRRRFRTELDRLFSQVRYGVVVCAEELSHRGFS